MVNPKLHSPGFPVASRWRSPPRPRQGREAAKSFLDDNPDLRDEVRQAVLAKLAPPAKSKEAEAPEGEKDQ